MNKTIHILLVVCSAAIALTACHKSDYQVVATDNGLNSNTDNTVATLLASLPSPAQTFHVAAGTSQTVSGKNGTRIYFYPNSFQDALGSNITQGIIDLQLTEIYTPGGLVQNGGPTISAGKLIGSGGQICIKASMNGKQVFANKYGIGFRANTDDAQPMNLFYSADRTTNLTTWTQAAFQNGTVIDGPVVDSFSVLAVDSSGAVSPTTFHTYYNRFDSCTHFNWINCGWFLQSNGATTNLSVSLSDVQFNNSNTVAFLLLPDSKSFINLSAYSNSTRTFSLASGYEVPVGLKADVIVLAVVSGNYYAYIGSNITITNGLTINPILTPTTLDHLQTSLSTL